MRLNGFAGTQQPSITLVPLLLRHGLYDNVDRVPSVLSSALPTSVIFNIMSLNLLRRCAPLIAALAATSHAQGFQEVNGQLYSSGLAIINSPQPDTPMGGDTLHVSIDVSGNGRLDLPPYPDNFDNGIASLTLFLTSTVTGLNLTISNGTFNGWSDDTLETPEFLCNSTTNEDFENAGCQQIMLQESSSTVKHVNWVWPNCLVGDGGADNGNCNSNAPLDDCVGGTARGPYNVGHPGYSTPD